MNSSDKIQDSEKMFVIKLARCFLTEAVESSQNYKMAVDQWSPEYYDGEDKKLLERQNILESCGCSNFLISIFKENLTTRVELLNEVLLLGIAYLFNGNTQCQNSLLESLKSDQENEMLMRVEGLIKYIGNFII